MSSENSRESFEKVKLWFTKLVNHNSVEQTKEINNLLKQGVLNQSQSELLRQMLNADSEPDLTENIQSVSNKITIDESIEDSDLLEKQINQYRVIKVLGLGGMGQVYLAERNDGMFEQKVALKLPNHNFNEEMKLRFENERQILAQLTHNNIARLLDGGTTKEGRPYLAMEYIEGQTIDKYCVKNIPDLNARIELIIQTCKAVTFAHQNLILHRDLKPANILVTDDGTVKLLDFGIAKLFDPEDEIRANQTATQIMTRNYASPEQIQGKPVSTHSDLFSLAIIAYELITGFHPYQHETQLEREQKLVSGKVMRVTERTDSSKAVFPELSKIQTTKIKGDLENILLKALSIEPEKRYTSVQAFADDLNNYLQNKPVSARKPSPIYTFRKLVQRNKATAFLTIITLGALVFSTIYSINKANIAAFQKNIAELESEKANHVSNFLKNLFKKAKPMSNSTQLTAQDLLFQGLNDIENEEFTDSEVKQELLILIHKSLISLGKLQESGDLIEKHLQNCILEVGEQNKSCIQLLLIKSDIFHKQHQWQKSLDVTKKAEALALKRNPIDSEEIAEIYADMNANLINLDRKKEARDYIYKTIVIAKNTNPPNDKLTIQTTHNLALSYIFEKDYETAKKLIDSIPQHLEKLPKKDIPLWLGSHYGLKAFFFSKLGESHQSFEYRLKRVELMESSYELLPIKHGRYLKSAADMAQRAGESIIADELYSKSYQFYVNRVSNSRYYQYEILTYQTLLNLLLNNNTRAQELFKIIEQASLNDPELDGYEQITYYHIAKLFINLSRNKPIEQLQSQFEMLYQELEPKFEQSPTYQLYMALIESKIKLLNGDNTSAKNILDTINLLFMNFPNDKLTIRKAIRILSDSITGGQLN
ncbi:MAG TPA: serine/threonine-protein kinase [Gammaproteobacteria bacterium]|nr:serine/threonine-protein kinase [Gammaproteobacteria bacterium]